MLAENASPYLMEEPPTSPGRVLLSRAFSHWCVLHYGYSDEDLAGALDRDGDAGDADRGQVAFAARLLGELACAGQMRASARPIGGGLPVPLEPSVWERDDFRPIFARSAIDLAKPYDDGAAPTHWVFLDVEDFDVLLQRSLARDLAEAEGEPTVQVSPEPDPATEVGSPPDGDHVRMPELERRTGMSRATIYRRIAEKRFPQRIPMDGNISAWRESDVADWLANPR